MLRFYAQSAELSLPGRAVRKSGIARGLMRLPAHWLQRLKHRHELSLLDHNQMRDVGLNPELIRRECEKPFWRH